VERLLEEKHVSDPFVKVVKFSVSDRGIPLITVHMRYWRAIHAEIMTHRVFSRNARSSRAVPIQKIINEVKYDPFVPRHWGANQRGMQAGEECNASVILPSIIDNEPVSFSRENAWCEASTHAVLMAEGFKAAGYHKQIVNRLLEPYMWIDTLVTSTDWANFFALRDHRAAEPHFRDLAQLTKEAIMAARGDRQLLEPGEWHLPYVDDSEYDLYKIETLRKISAARCARISYAPFDGNASVEAELDRYDKLVNDWPVHASPVEHQATPDVYVDGYQGPYGEWRLGGYLNKSQHRNFRGWRPFRSMIPGETVWDDKDQWMKELVA
jgi:hypothetical protein